MKELIGQTAMTRPILSPALIDSLRVMSTMKKTATRIIAFNVIQNTTSSLNLDSLNKNLVEVPSLSLPQAK